MRTRSTLPRRLLAVVLLVMATPIGAAPCSGAAAGPAVLPNAGPPPTASAPPPPLLPPIPTASPDAGVEDGSADAEADSGFAVKAAALDPGKADACPGDMVLVDGDY